MDVNRAAEGVLISGLGPRQPHDPGDDRVAAWGIRLEHLAGGSAGFKNRSKRRIVANFFRDLKAADGSAVASRTVTEAELGGGNFVAFDRATISDQKHFLIAHADDHFIMSITAIRKSPRPAAIQTGGGKQTQGR